MTHPADEQLEAIEQGFRSAVESLLELLDKHGPDRLSLALEEATAIWNAEQEHEQ